MKLIFTSTSSGKWSFDDKYNLSSSTINYIIKKNDIKLFRKT